MIERIQMAAQARAAGTIQPADRPRERRSSEVGQVRGSVLVPAKVELRAKGDSDRLDFHGIASVTERGYEMYDAFGPYTEVVEAGAFADTLARADLDVVLVLGHDSMRRIARTKNGSLVLAETDEGLDVLASDLDPSDADVAYIVPKLRSGLIDEMSFMFRIESGQWSPDYSEYRITRVDIHRGDVSIVGYGANPHTSASLRASAPVDVRTLAALAAYGV